MAEVSQGSTARQRIQSARMYGRKVRSRSPEDEQRIMAELAARPVWGRAPPPQAVSSGDESGEGARSKSPTTRHKPPPPKGWWERCLRDYEGANSLNWHEVGGHINVVHL
eukprot:7330274-Pyramimonas_sp.AAC.1